VAGPTLESEGRVGSCGGLVKASGSGWARGGMGDALCCDVGRGGCGKLSTLSEPPRSATVELR